MYLNLYYYLIILLFLQYFWSNKCNLGEHKRLLVKKKKKLPTPNFKNGLCEKGFVFSPNKIFNFSVYKTLFIWLIKVTD